jgi:hypothetical protein
MTDNMDKPADELRAKAREICMYVLPDCAEADIKSFLDKREADKALMEQMALALLHAQNILARLTKPDMSDSVMHTWSHCVEVEAEVGKALAAYHEQEGK